MKRVIGSLLFFSMSVSHAQKTGVFIDSILRNRTLRIPVYQLATIGNQSKLLSMPFGKSEFLDTAGIYCLRDAELLSIDLVFTDYPAKLDLKPLNRSRFLTLTKLLPNAMSNPNTLWQVIRQMDGYDKETAMGMVHGFVINYRKKPSRSETRKEIELVKAMTPEEIIIAPEPEKIPPPKKVNNWEVIHRSGRTKYLFYHDRQIKSIGPDKKEVAKGMEKRDSLFSLDIKEARQLKLLTENDKVLYAGKDSTYILLYPRPQEDTFLMRRMYRPSVIYQRDSSVMTVLKRNRFRNMLVVADVTGSMSPYTSQIVQWLSDEANQQNLRSFVCFNDGDSKQNEAKEIGSTGGIYGEIFKDPIQISELIQHTMYKGGGGDTPENVCEALIKGIGLFSNYEDVVLIADNWAPVRDISLVGQVTKPIRIVACGDFAPHPDYVDIAFHTRGSLHLSNEDITDLSALTIGKPLTIRGKSYVLQNGRVVVQLR